MLFQSVEFDFGDHCIPRQRLLDSASEKLQARTWGIHFPLRHLLFAHSLPLFAVCSIWLIRIPQALKSVAGPLDSWRCTARVRTCQNGCSHLHPQTNSVWPAISRACLVLQKYACSFVDLAGLLQQDMLVDHWFSTLTCLLVDLQTGFRPAVQDARVLRCTAP